MNTKTLFVSVALSFLFSSQLFAQKDTVMIYMQEVDNGYDTFVKPAMNKEDATFIRVLMSPDTDKSLYRVNDYYLNGKLKLSGESLSPMWYSRLQGICVEYFENGHKKKVATYDNGKLEGDLISYFPNGRVNTIKEMHEKTNIYGQDSRTVIFKDCLDSLGKTLAEKGEGKWLEYRELNQPYAEGLIKGGIEDGEWHGKVNDTLVYTCKYVNGVLKDGQSTGASGNIYYFNSIRILPEYPGGVLKFGNFIGKLLNYPADAREKRIQGKVLINFIVKKDGLLEDFSVVKNLFPSLDNEALNAIQNSPKWLPGTYFGVKQDFSYTVPISFSLAYDN